MNVDAACRRLIESGDYTIKVTGRTDRGRPRKLATIIGSPGDWRPTSERQVGAALDELVAGNDALGASLLGECFKAVAADVCVESGTELFRGEIAWPIMSLVCDVVHSNGRREVSIDAVRSVARQYGSRITAIESLPLATREAAAELIRSAISRVVVLPSR